ncbi:40-residue YVTN family beta-propeller repeat protein [Natrialba magadii ATCC 43099]|uniref:40-residue YVTN family beta-propeller repeat protein n=1 Tax=Natrialba magadii (strain ATCC 43099 / DSM 3394 / CCM 3739 / CIP 104546 / IAM 13178 / JCM 8861 / NBRC 102185 / NCIMB 2190 / MS3) TaxID=547559 RepID=D3SY43_NATMM|nr:YncE family protein [Natrialba magadii]ADD04083.1 40-residue YVTN family beta-propeller repeat protein [Natrialba magadii ATCC 43099]ELY33240.1 40-residue YVTN family beta-propeller repeat-containing protein [Natrialba magadii ATCC 43099]
MDDRLIVLNKDADAVSYIDPETGETTATVETDFNPHEVAVSPDGARSYVTCSLGGSLLALDNETHEVVDRFEHELFDFPHGLAVRKSAGELWLASTYSSHMFVFDVETMDLLADFPTYQDKSHMVTFSPDAERAYVANIGSDNVTVIDADERRIVGDPPVGESPEGIGVDPETGQVLVANQDDGRLTVLNPDSLAEENVALLSETPIRVVLSPDGRYAFVPNRESNDVSVIDTEHVRDGERRPWEIARIPVGIWPGGTTFAPDGDRAFVANNKTNDVSVIDVDAFEEIDRYETGLHPDGIAYLSR